MIEITKDNAFEVVSAIKDECSKHKESCKLCPLFITDVGCLIQDDDKYPEEWVLIEKE